MKKSIVLSTMFLFVFGMTLGMTLSLSNKVQAYPECTYECEWELEFSDDTGPECPGPCPSGMVYIIWKKATCGGGPLNCPYFKEATGCWDGSFPIGCKLLPF